MQTSLSIMDYILTISGSLILLLLGGIGYFLRQFASSVKDLKNTVEQLKIVLSVEQEKITNIKESVNTSLTNLDTRLTIIGAKVEQNEKDIIVLKTILND